MNGENHRSEGWTMVNGMESGSEKECCLKKVYPI